MTLDPSASVSPAATDGRTYRVGAGGLLQRSLGVMLWRAADPRTLPVRPEGWESARPDRGRLFPLLAVLVWALTLGVAVAGFGSWHHFRSLRSDFLRIPPGLSLDAAAEQMEQAARGPWRLLHPRACRIVTRLAGSVREGQGTLQAAATAYLQAGEMMRGLSPVNRVDRGRSLVEPVHAALTEVRTPWHRETLAFRELQGGIAPYLAGPSPESGRLRGRLAAVTPGHALQLSVLDSGRQPRESPTAPLAAGGGFDLPLVPDGWLLVTDLVHQPRGGFEVREEMQIPLREWTEGAIRFPRGEAVAQVHFTSSSDQAAPLLPELSAGARAELGWPSPDGASTKR